MSWTAPARIPIDTTTSTVDHFIPGLGIDPTTSGSTAHLGLTYYYYPQTNCAPALMRDLRRIYFLARRRQHLECGHAHRRADGIELLPSTFSGQMVADYVATSFAGGKAYGVFAVAKAKRGSTFDQAIYTTKAGFDVAASRGYLVQWMSGRPLPW